MPPQTSRLTVPLLAVLTAVRTAASDPSAGVILTPQNGPRYRVQALSPTLVRVEAEGPHGFEDRPTFLVQDRQQIGPTAVPLRKEGSTRAVSDHYAVDVGQADPELGPVAVFGPNTAAGVLWQGWLANVSTNAPMPQPAENFSLWALADRPRFAAPAEGAIPGSAGLFDLTNQADDVYFFVSGPMKLPYTALRTEVLKLSGPVPLLPDYAFGTMFTWYHNYTAAAKLAEIREFGSRGIPLDVASLDMDWRLHPCYPNSLTPNCTDTPLETETQYVPNTELIPDMQQFIRDVHALNASLFFNDHPMPPGPTFTELSPKEIQFRYDGLTSLLDQGLDFWWFDCHWHDLIPGIQCPGKTKGCADGVDYATWGQYVEWSVMAKHNKQAGKRTMMLGCENPNMHRASHRTPVWWTGDNAWDALALGVQQMVNGGVDLKPYVHQDCGGHHGPGNGMTLMPDGSPNPWGHLGNLPYPGEVYARWLQYCSLGAVTRIHSAPSSSRLPWKFGTQAESVAKRFLLMRRSLAPTLVAAARQTSLDGTPLVRRCDLIWPEHAADGANSSDDLLVRPIDPFLNVPLDNETCTRVGIPDRCSVYKPVDGKYNRGASVWLPPGEWHDAFSGEVLQGGRTLNLREQGVERMPLFHRGGSLVITASGSDASGWVGLVANVWPTRALFTTTAAAGDELAPPLTRLLYAPSVMDPDGSAPPLVSVGKIERPGGSLSLDFSAAEGSPSQLWTVRVHVPVASTPTSAARLRCADADVPLTAHAPSALHSMPFAEHHAPPRAPNAVLEGRVAVASTMVRCTFVIADGDDTQ